MTAPLAPQNDRPQRRAWRLLRRAGLAAAVTLLGLELALRLLLFADVEALRRVGAPLRDESLYADHASGRAYWRLGARFHDRSEPHPYYHPELGWLKEELDSRTLRHRDEAQLAGRRPVLLFGDSFGACVTRPEHCWEGTLERAELGERFAILNYAVGGYGLDQIYLLLARTLDLYRDADPVVIVGVLVDDDLDRCYLGVRNYPKPRFRLVADELVLVPPAARTAADYARDHPPGIASYLWRFALFGTDRVPPARAIAWTDEADHVNEKRVVAARVLEAIHDELATRELEFFFALFHGRRGVGSDGPYGWQEPLLYEFLRERAVRFVSSKRVLLAHAANTGRDPQSYFIAAGSGLNHYMASTNRIVFRALQYGLLGYSEPYEYLGALPDDPTRGSADGEARR